MYFLDTYPRYYLVSADFQTHKELSLQGKTRLVIEEYQEELRAYYEKEGKTPPLTSVMSRYFIILWRNLPKTNIDDNTEDTLFEMMCQSMANPTVAAATAAAMGVLTPMPCTPVPAGPWAPGVPQVLVGGKPAVNNQCKLTCSYGGTIQFTNSGCQTVQL